MRASKNTLSPRAGSNFRLPSCRDGKGKTSPSIHPSLPRLVPLAQKCLQHIPTRRQRQQRVLEDHFEHSPDCSRTHFSEPKFSSSAGGCLTVEVNEVAPTYTGSELTLWIDMYRVAYSNSVVAKTRHLCQSIWQVHWYMSANCLRYLLKNYSNFLILKYFICTMIRKRATEAKC